MSRADDLKPKPPFSGGLGKGGNLPTDEASPTDYSQGKENPMEANELLLDFFSRLVKVDEYYTSEMYFDLKSKYFYELDGDSEDGWKIYEFRPTHSEYQPLLKTYRKQIEKATEAN